MHKYVWKKQPELSITSTSKDLEAILHSYVFLQNLFNFIDFVATYTMYSTMPVRSCDMVHLPLLALPNTLVDGMTYFLSKGKQKLSHSLQFRVLPPTKVDIPSPTCNISIDIEDKGLPSTLQN